MKISLAQIIDTFHVSETNFKKGLSELWRHYYLKVLLIAGLIINGVEWFLAVFVVLRIKEEIIALHHNIYFGINLIGEPRQIFFIPLLGFIIIIINTIFSYLVKEDDDFFMYVFAATSALVNFFLLLGLGSIIMINFR